MKLKKAIITGIYGQDGSYLCEYLTSLGYEVYGFIQETMSLNSQRIKKYMDSLYLPIRTCCVDLYNYESVYNAIKSISPDEIYHLAANHVSSEGNFSNEVILFQKNVIATSNILSSVFSQFPECKVLTAGSCLMFDGSETVVQDENTPYKSNSFYGLAKITENEIVKYYRDKGFFCCSAILYNHESIRRSESFVTRKIISNMVGIKKGIVESFTLGNLEQQKDWGYAKDYSIAMYHMLQLSNPVDLVLSTGEMHTIGELVDLTGIYLGIKDYSSRIILSENIVKRKVKSVLCGDSSLAISKGVLKHSFCFENLFKNMIDKELQGVL